MGQAKLQATLVLSTAMVILACFPNTVAQARDLPVTGGPGGGGFRQDCTRSSPKFLAGIEAKAGAFVDAIGPKCATFIDHQQEFGPRTGLMLKGGTGGARSSIECGRTEFVAGIKIGFTREGNSPKYVDFVELICRRIAGGEERRVCLNTGNGCPDHHPDRPSLKAVTQRCSDSEFATGIHGRHGVFVDALGLICRPKPAVSIATSPSTPQSTPPSSLGDRIAAYAEAQLDKCVDAQGRIRPSACPALPAGQVGDGECTHLVQAALKTVGAKPPIFSPRPYDWGSEIPLTSAQRGDIVQLEATQFTKPGGGASWGTGTGPEARHSAIIVAKNGDMVTLIEQNTNNLRAVKRHTYDFSWPHTGRIIVYRAESRERLPGRRWQDSRRRLQRSSGR